MEELFCIINPFSNTQQIFKINTETSEKKLIDNCKYIELSNELDFLMHRENIFILHLLGRQNDIDKVVVEIPSGEYTIKKDFFNF